eukprot:13088571-Heterocapsa_arctica.AAC.1
MNQAEKTEVIRLDKIHAGKGEGAGTSTETGGPTDAAVAHEGGEYDDPNTCDENILNVVAAVPLPKPLPVRSRART